MGLLRKEGVKSQWDQAAIAWVDFVRRGKDYYRDELNNPAAFSLIGDIQDKVVLDLACGEGYNTRILAREGANVVGVDFSKQLIEYARQSEAREKLGITYYVIEAANLKGFLRNHFDLVTCFMALQDIENHEQTVAEVARVLKSKGRFILSIPHPCFETIVRNRKRVSASQRYFGVVKYAIDWDMERLAKPFKTASFHRTLTDYSAVLFKNKLCVSRFIEPQPTKQGLQKHPALRKILIRPQSIIFESIKTTAYAIC